MKIIICWVGLCVNFSSLLSQNTFTAIVKDKETKEVLVGVNVILENSNRGGTTNLEGIVVINDIPVGSKTFRYTYMGYETCRDTVGFPIEKGRIFVVLMEPRSHEGEEIMVTAMRSSRTIEETPTRVEVIAAEELDEKATMKPGDIRMQLNESTGIQVQQTSATSANANFRIQGLDGRYTQLLRDGFPLYSGFAGGLSIMQIPPLDLKQIEIVKGSASTLYGGGAIAGVVNLVSKEPEEEKEISMLLNGTSAGGYDLSAYAAQKYDHLGYTLFVSGNGQTAYDPDNDNFSDIPDVTRFTVNPNIFYYHDESSTASLRLNASVEKRLGGDMDVIENGSNDVHTYFEKNRSQRLSTQLQFEKKIDRVRTLILKQSVHYFGRRIELQDYRFKGYQVGSYSELAYSQVMNSNEWTVGLSLWTDRFNDRQKGAESLNLSSTTVGAFAQNNWAISEKIKLESGVRADYEKNYGFFLLPRVSAFYKIIPGLTTRLGFGLGYKIPNIFNEESEEVGFRNVRPVNVNKARAETSTGANWDVNYTGIFLGQWTLSINQLFFYTRLDKPFVLNSDSSANGVYIFENTKGYTDTKGFESNLKVGYGRFKLFAGYTFTDIQRHAENLAQTIPVTTKHRIGLVLIYEAEGKFRIGYEAYYTGRQKLSNGNDTRDYWIQGVMAERKWNHFSLFVNFENLFDTRQSRFESMFTGTRQQPLFKEIYAPTDGFVTNAGIKIRL
ncbi:TonB-dependent receptor [bacterium]|nr:TonB-dependent receptor [bacterium]